MRAILLLAVLLPLAAQARMFPRGKEPKLKIHTESGTGISQADFNAILSRMQKTFDPIYAAKGQRLKINNLWSDETINSDAHWEGTVCVINAYGGLARAPGMTVNAYLMVNGHENGHCSGEPPLYPGDTMSDEGQADTFSVDASRKAGLTDADIQAGAKALNNVLASLSQEPPVAWPGPVLPVVKTTYHDHSAAQCRFDTMMFRDLGAPRPNCWYAGGAPTGVIPSGDPNTPPPPPTCKCPPAPACPPARRCPRYPCGGYPPFPPGYPPPWEYPYKAPEAKG